MKRVLRIITLLMGIAIFKAASAEAVEISASVNNKVVSVGDRTVLSVRITNAPRGSEPQLPPLEGFRVEGTSHSTQIQIVNGAGSISSEYNYTLVALAAGKHVIGPVAITAQGKQYQTQPIEVEVTATQQAAARRADEVAQAEAPPAAAGNKQMFIEITANKPNPFLHEEVILTFRFYCAAALAEQPVYEPAAAPGCVEKMLGDGRSRNYERVVNGRRYQVSELKTSLFPYQTGELTIGPAKLGGFVLTESQRRGGYPPSMFDMDSFFEDAFGHYNRQSFQLTSNQVKINVRPLPKEGAPNGEVSVGHYQLQVEAKPKEVHAGDPITLTMIVSGEGNLESVVSPRLSTTEGFKTYEPTGSAEINKGAESIRGVKRFEQAIVPLSDKIQQIPEVIFDSFNPQEAKYVTLRSGPIPVKVLPPNEEGAAKIVSGAAGQEKKGVQLLERNIVFIKTTPGELTRIGQAGATRILFWCAQCIPLLLVLLAFVHSRHRERLRSDVSYARLHRTGRMTSARLKSAEDALGRHDVEGFYSSLVKALNMYVADRLNVPAGGLTPEMIRDKLTARGLNADLIRRIDDFSRSCEFARFASAKPDRSQMEKSLREETAILEELRRSRFAAKG